MQRVIRVISQKLHFLSGMAIVAMMAIMALDVIARYALKTSLLDTIEISSMFLGAVTSLALVSVTKEEEHIRFSLLIDRLSTRTQNLAKAVTLVISAALFCMLTWQTTIRAIASALGKSEDAIKANLYRMRRSIAQGAPGLESFIA